jgi:hypothetical protein
LSKLVTATVMTGPPSRMNLSSDRRGEGRLLIHPAA